MTFLNHYHPILVNQNLHYRIFGIFDDSKGLFNRAKLLNIGFKEALEIDDFDCFIFHDVDMLLLNPKLIYDCSNSPAHFAAEASQFSRGYFYYPIEFHIQIILVG